MTISKRILVSLALSAGASCLLGQTVFEVASIKPSANGSRGTTTDEGGQFHSRGATLRMLTATAYGVPEFRVEGGAGWTNSEPWDVEARADTPKRLSGAAIQAPLQSLLQQRFKLEVRAEQKEANVFFLDIGKSGVKMKPSAHPEGQPTLGAGNGMMSSTNVTTSIMASMLTRLLGRTVIDRTGLTAGYEVYTSWTPEVGEGDPRLAAPPPELLQSLEKRSIFAAVEEDLGLKLTSGKEAGLLVTILSAARPGEN